MKPKLSDRLSNLTIVLKEQLNNSQIKLLEEAVLKLREQEEIELVISKATTSEQPEDLGLMPND